MRRIAHISDLHFGATDINVVAGLLRELTELGPDLIVVSGDLTQRARRHEFQAAREFLDELASPKLIVPGNHDIPLDNLVARFLKPLSRYRELITDDLAPLFVDAEIAVAGVNTARSNTWKSGRIGESQIESVRQQFESTPPGLVRVLVSHHPFVPPQEHPTGTVVGRAQQTLTMLNQTDCHLILSGHLHQAFSSDLRPYHVEVERSVLVVQAGTATSNRRRGEANGYNLLEVAADRLQLQVRTWDGRAFQTTRTRQFQRGAGGWQSLP